MAEPIPLCSEGIDPITAETSEGLTRANPRPNAPAEPQWERPLGDYAWAVSQAMMAVATSGSK